MNPVNLNQANQKLSAAHDLMMLGHTKAKLAASRQHLDHHRRKGLGMPTNPQYQSSEDDMFVLGDVTVQQSPQSSPPQSSVGSLLGKVAVAGAAASGLGIPLAAVLWASSAWQKPAATPAKVPAGTHTDFDYTVESKVIPPAG